MDDIESLFSTRRGRHMPLATDEEEQSHVLFDEDDMDLLGDAPVQPSRTTNAAWGKGAPALRTGSTASVHKTESLFDRDVDEDEYTEDLHLRPIGSSKQIEADDEPDMPWQPTAHASRRTRSGPSRRRASRARAAPSQEAQRLPETPSILSLLAQDVVWQLRSFRQRFQRRMHKLQGRHVQQTTRTIIVNDPTLTTQHIGYNTNQVLTNKYNVVTFVPRFLCEQFAKYANVFFLFIGILQQIPGVSPTNRWTTLVPLAIVLLASACTEITEDWRRYKSDAEMNARLVQVLDPSTSSWIKRPWRDVAVGDIVRVERNEFFPADLVLLSSSEPEGLAYVETANLDGETNLKIKQAPTQTAQCTSARTAAEIQGSLVCEVPNNSLYTFEGTMQLSSTFPVGPDQLLLRGAQLRNAPWIYGLAVFTGHDTKLLQNATSSPLKRTRVEKQVNALILSLFVLLLALSIFCAVGALFNARREKYAALYLMPQLDARTSARAFVESILTFIILYNSLIPISLIVSMDMVKFQLASLINSDLDMYYAPSDTPALCRRPNLVEDLGQVEYIFSDKTGTLTRNEMEFKQAAIGGISFLDTPGEARAEDEFEGARLVVGQRTWATLPAILEHNKDGLRRLCDEFLTVLAVCHTVIPETVDGKIVFQASSPDEAALVAGAQSLGYAFTTRKPHAVYINVRGETREYQVLQVCEFNSTRKRMSTIVRLPNGQITLFCKGADTVIFPRLKPDQECTEATLGYLEEYAAQGLRTLCIARRNLAVEEHAAWAQKYERAAASVHDRAGALDAVAEEIEVELELLGATAIEDKLQDGVPDTIATLQAAGIKVWILTGDRQETAINIGYSCRLISESMNLLIVNEATPAETAEAVRQQLETVRTQLGDTGPQEELALIVEGRSLQHALQPSLAPLFLSLAGSCKAVICCRVSPLQKALVVELVKQHTNAILLAIGDGANDVGMIQAAHLGVGISGLEGLQAARSADVAIGQFRFLKKLLLVHGTWSYARLSKMILYSFYKTVTLYLTLFWLSFYNRFSGQTAYESWTQSFYNVLFTMMPTLVLGIFDQYLSAAMLERYPQLYGQAFFTGWDIGMWMANAVYHSIVNFFLVTYAFYDTINDGQGQSAYYWIWGTTLYFTMLTTALGKAAVVSNLWTRYTLMAIPGSLGITLAFFVVFGTVAPGLGVSMEYYSIVPRLLGLPVFWLLLVFVPVCALLRDVLWRFYQRTYRPKDYHIVQEMQKYKLQDVYPRTDQFQKNIRKVRAVQRVRRSRGYAFSQTEGEQADLIRQYDTTKERPSGL
ncbi:P-type phospholipid transporter [Malassezia vespertilionis]|uniref:Phospholipid-transporting ATPase n=1 Tax=Malassezia vespertilionis TaxID=2020962 RepID=A0A2N1JG47_9BASI|nr:P-type phospholipid transporter [Malassezia vespertilionis]PKI85530.1 hypothetical protein MVES_000210 [Malassezia vespertilionis]WFD04896.1 P-type phospholipid transporter [Malassezia vespertilionis]